MMRPDRAFADRGDARDRPSPTRSTGLSTTSTRRSSSSSSRTGGAPTAPSPRRSGCPRPPCASGSRRCARPASCRSWPSPTRCSRISAPGHGRDPGRRRHPRGGRPPRRVDDIDYVVMVTAGSFDILVELVCEDEDHLLELLNGRIRQIPGVRSTETFMYLKLEEADLYLGDQMTDLSNDRHRLQESAHRHLWMHFTRMSSYATMHEIPVITRGEGVYVYDQHGKRYLDGLSGLFTSHGSATAAPSWPRPPPSRPRSSPTSRCGATPTRRRSSWPNGSPDLTPGDSTASSSPPVAPRPSSRPGSWPASTSSSSASPAVQGDQPDIAYHGATMGALSITGVTEPSSTPFEPLVPGAVQGAEHQLLPGPLLRATTSRPSAGGPPTPSSRRSCPRAPTRSPPSSSSRCRTPAAASRRRPDTSSGCARSATGTASCWCPTRSSAPSAGSATSSVPSATATCPTSSPWPRASRQRLLADRRDDGRQRPGHRALPESTARASCTASPSPATRSAAAVALANLDVFEKEGSSTTCSSNEAEFKATLRS
jgi:hypothetical protein